MWMPEYRLQGKLWKWFALTCRVYAIYHPDGCLCQTKDHMGYLLLRLLSCPPPIQIWTISRHNIDPGHNIQCLADNCQVQIVYQTFVSGNWSVCGVLTHHFLCPVYDRGKKITALVYQLHEYWNWQCAAVLVYCTLDIDFSGQTHWLYNQNRVSLPGCENKIFFFRLWHASLNGMSSE